MYFLAIWTYTLLPLPDPDSIRCAGVNLDVFALVDDIRGAVARPGITLTDPAVLQLLLNVLLFVPLGFFLRVLGNRGILVALMVGFALSAFIETTQLTGVWGLYPCAYRVFDVDDLLTNTTGAVLGSLLSLIVPRRLRGMARTADADDPDPVTRGRRLISMVCDLLAAALTSLFAGVVTQLFLEFVVGDHDAVLDGDISSLASGSLPLAIWLIVALTTGRTVGDHAVQLRYERARGTKMPEWLARPLRFAGGIGGYLALGLLPEPWNALAAPFAIASLILVFTTDRARGLPGLVSGQHLHDARDETRPRPAAAPGD